MDNISTYLLIIAAAILLTYIYSLRLKIKTLQLGLQATTIQAAYNSNQMHSLCKHLRVTFYNNGDSVVTTQTSPNDKLLDAHQKPYSSKNTDTNLDSPFDISIK